MTRDEVKLVIREVLEEEREMRSATQDVLVLKTVAAILTAFGMNEDDKAEIRSDFIYLRHWRKTAEQMQRG